MPAIQHKRQTRDEVAEHLKWDLKDLFETEEAWETELSAIKKDLSGVTQYKGTLSQGASQLLACLNDFEAIRIRLIRVATYASLKESADGRDPKNQANGARANALTTQVGAALSFIRSEILTLPDGAIESYIEEESDLSVYEKYLKEVLETKPHTLSPETEAVLASLGELNASPYIIYSRSKSSDMQFDPIIDDEGNERPVSFALYEDLYEQHPDANLRKKAYQSFVKTLENYQNTFAATYSTEVTKQVALAKLRNYNSVTEMLLDPQQVTMEMYENQLDVIQKELAPHMRRYAQLKKRVLGLDKMLFCDLKAPLDPEFNPATTYEEASKTILEALSVMGPEYTEIIRKGLTERWVDLADNVGKATGAFCSSPYGVHPYILITWTDAMRSAFVLAHELGHAGHFYLAGHNQKQTNTRPSMYFVEAPSTMNEMLLGR
ncbi:MAG TPA: M3 family metallopeptidase, partial [Candidatus Angelobacter sp.]|nr:M3 family metallopeptidase [Candidatus Angelobacter sp.]